MKSVRKLWFGWRKSERGQALVLFAAGLALFFGLVGLSIDIGQVVMTRTDLQKTADAAAFAGAEDLPNSGTAATTADSYVSLNTSGSTSGVDVTTSSQANDTIRVTASKHVSFGFLKFIGLEGQDVSASATVRIRVVTGFEFDEEDVFPYAVWGGARTPGHTNSCPFNICVGSNQVYRANGYGNSSHAAAPDWDVNGNNFKGYFHHGGQVVQIDPATWQTFSSGGNAIGQEPTDALDAHIDSGEPIIVPVIAEAECKGGCGTIKFKIVAWVALEITSRGNSSQDWTGEVVEHFATPHGVTDGSNQPPAGFPVIRTATLTE